MLSGFADYDFGVMKTLKPAFEMNKAACSGSLDPRLVQHGLQVQAVLSVGYASQE